MGLIGAAHGCEGAKKASLPKISHTYPTIIKLGTVIPYLKEIKEMYESRDTPCDFSWHQHFFFTGNQQILLYQEIQVLTAFWCIISNFFIFYRVFKYCYNKHRYNFHDVSKNGCPRPLENKCILEKRLWRHNFCQWHYQQNLITWFKLCCRCGYLVW